MNNNDSNINALGEKIRTVFYFVDDLEYEGTDGYKDMCQKGQIELRTIVFAKKQRAIYKGGDMYCPMEDETFKRILLRMLDDEDVIDALIQFIKKHRNNLPIASREELGAIMVGLTLNIAENGTLDINEDAIKNIIKNYINNAGSNDIPKASKDQYGIVKIGDGINVDNGVISVKFNDLPSTTQDELLNLIYQFFQNKSNLRASTTQYGVVKIDPNGGILVNDGIISVDTPSIIQNIINNTEGDIVSGLNYAITDFVSNGTMLTISQNNNTDKSVNIENAVKQSIQNFIDNGDTIINNIGEKTQVSVDQTLTSGTQIATITVDGTSTILFAPTGSGSGGGGGDNPGGGGSKPYDDTDIKNAIRDLQDRANQTESDLRDLLDETEEEVREKFKNAFDTYEDLIEYYKQSGDTTPTKFTFGKEDADEWASQMGLITPNGDGTYNIGWSTLTQTYNSLAGEVAQIKANQSAGGEINYEALSAGLYAYIDENAATSGMDSTWGKFVKKDDGEIQMLEWMQAAIKTYASDQEAYARLLAAAKDYDENGDTIQEGIARIHAFVEKDSNGNYVAGTSLSSMIEDGVNNSLSEVYTENHPNSAVAGLYARLKGAEDTADDNYEAISGLQNKVEKIDGEYIAKADLVTSLKNKKDEIMSASGLDISASINAATSNLSSQIDGTYAKISTTVTKDPVTKKIESEVRLNADQIYLDGTTWAELINAEQIVADQLESQNIKTSELEVFGNGTKLSINGTNGILLEGQNSNPYHFDIDGSGQLANSAISWNANGDITLGSKFINAVNADVSVNSLEAGTSNKVYVNSSDGVYVKGTCDSQINPDGSGYLGNNGNSSAIAWNTDGSGSIANGAITWRSFSDKYLALAIEAGEMMIGSFARNYAVISSDRIGVVSSGVKGVRMFGDRSDGIPSLWVYDVDANCHYLPTGPSISSDMRKKDVVENENISIEDIADAPLFKYRMKGCQDGCVQIGSSAQYWQDLVPEAVSSDEEGYLRMNYVTLNTVASLTSAKEIVKLKEENTVLKQRVEALEARLQLIENKLNE